METYAIIFASTFSLIGLGFCVFGVHYLRKARATLRWPKADGTISWSKVADWYDIDGDIMYGAQIEYRYVVDGVSYTGNRLNVSMPQTSSPDRHERIVACYPKGAAVRVAYNPEKPFYAVLEPGAPISAYLPLLLGLGMTVLASGMLYSLLTSEWTAGTW